MTDATTALFKIAKRVLPYSGFFANEWRQHPNGGGWVSIRAVIAPTAFIGPDAVVMDGAKILGRARVEGNAIVRDAAIVADRSLVTDLADISGSACILGKSRITGNAEISGLAVIIDQRVKTGSFSPSSRSDHKRWREASAKFMTAAPG